MQTKHLLGILVLILLALVLWRVLAWNVERQPPADTPTIATTIFPLADILRNVGGDAVEVVQLIPAGADPHHFEPTPSVAATIATADVLYSIGYAYDDWVKNFVGSTPDVINLAADITKRRTANQDGSISIDPHYWLTIPNAKSMATLAARDLGSRFPEHRATFAANLASYMAALDAADAEIHATLANAENKNLVTQHGAWYYFAEEYGFDVVGTFETSEASEPSPKDLASLAAIIEDANLETLYADFGEPKPALVQFAADNKMTILSLDAEGAGESTSYIDLMKTNAETIAKNE